MDDQFDFGSYAPSVGVNSRSGSMKKLTRKTDKSPIQQQKKNNKKNADFDELDQLLNGDINAKKKDTSLNKNTSIAPSKKANDTLDSFFDQPSTNLNITSKINDKKQSSSNKMDLARTSINFNKSLQKKNDFEIIDQDHHFGNISKVSARNRSKSPTNDQIKLLEQTPSLQTHTSMRNMRPPLKRKQSQTGLGIVQKSSNDLKLGLSLNVEQRKQSINKNVSNNLNLSIFDNDNDMKPSKSVNMSGRRGSMDNKSQKRFETGLTLFGEQAQKKEANISHFNISSFPQKQYQRPEPSALKIESPKGRSQMSELKIGESIMINEKHSQFYQQPNTSILKDNRQSNQTIDLEKKQTAQYPNSSQYSFQGQRSQYHAKLVQPPKLTVSSNLVVQLKQKSYYDYQKEVQHLKLTYQKQLSFLQQSLDRQIKINQQTRDRLINQSNKLIQQERKRSMRIHDQQLKRLKQMNQWQKRKMEQNYKFQIQNLKHTISQYQQATNIQSNSMYGQGFRPQSSDSLKYKKQIQALNSQLELQKKLLMDRQHFLTKRELELEQREQQFNNKKRREQEHYRQQQRVIMQKQGKMKNNILNEKKEIMNDKQKIAMDAANMELDIIKRKQKLDLLIKEAQMQKQSIENERHEVRTLNQQMMQRYKQKMNDLAHDKERVSNLQADLIRKLRIVQIKAKQCSIPSNQMSQTNAAKQNNWVKQRPHSTAAQKQQKQAQKLNETFQRYNKIEKIAQTNKHSNLNISNKLNKTSAADQINSHNTQSFKLDDYLVAINKNQKSRNNNFI